MFNDDVALISIEVDIYKADVCNWVVLIENIPVALLINVGVGHWFKSVTYCPL